ncbi:MAG: MATE family efflux transporter [Lachnospiraceae bacterium]|nr:MATE family efflux transporter [Lachnospiraceae bacterium]
MHFLKDHEGYCFTNKALVNLIIPLMVEQFLIVFVGIVDSIMVASVGEAAVSGVSLVDTIFILLISLLAALAIGGAVVCGQFLSKKEKAEACDVANQLVLFTSAFALAIMLLVYILRPFILNIAFGRIEADVSYNANLYLIIIAASLPMIALYNAGAAIFRMIGDSKIVMLMSLFMNGINIIGNAILLYGLKWGLEGIAIPTLISRMIAGVIMIVLLFNQEKVLHFSHPIVVKCQWLLLKKILHIGVPNGLENSMFQLGKIFILSMVSSFGTTSIAANALSNTLVTFQILPGIAMGLALLTVTVQSIGLGSYEQVRYYTKKIVILTYFMIWVTALSIIVLLPVFLEIYGLSYEATQLTTQRIIYHGICIFTIWPLSFILSNTLRAANDVKYCMWVSILSVWIFRIGFSLILGKKFGLGVFGVWIAMTLDWVVRAFCFIIRYLFGKWQFQS